MVAAEITLRKDTSSSSFMMNSQQQGSIYDDKAIAEYGYEDAAPDVRGRGLASGRPSYHRTSSMPRPMPRRSSLKQGDGSSRGRRRASIQMGEEVTFYLPGHDEPVRRRSSIKFSESVKVRNVESLKSLTDCTKESLWFQGEEYARMRRNSWDLVSRVERGQSGIGTKKFCVRGLERLLDRETVLHTREKAWNTVFAEQDLQRSRGNYDDGFVAHAYRCSTMDSARAAACRGKEDEQAILSYVRGMKGYCRRLSC